VAVAEIAGNRMEDDSLGVDFREIDSIDGVPKPTATPVPPPSQGQGEPAETAPDDGPPDYDG
jgi:hypothetical protein